ncbi:uncharacterized protein LOC134811933 [Bolinopsis microptera]|uniref:uncharacterized protein LOC134811933 n=1 Tax=Bolinopsis microptera TaxID=2820187 RepID=UPI00307ABD8A
MVRFVTSKRITYFLIIRQLRFDKHDFVAAELEKLFLNSLGNLDLFNLPPSDELERIIHSFSISSELLSNARSTLNYASYNTAPYGNPQLRKPNNHSSVSESGVFVVSQNNASTPVIPRADPRTDLAGSSITNQTTSESPVQVFKRGRTVFNSSSSSVSTHDQVPSTAPQTEEFVNELKKISQELRNVDEVSEKQSPNSFLSFKSSKAESPQCGTTLPQKTSSSYRSVDDLEIVADQAVESEEKILKITKDEAFTVRLSPKLMNTVSQKPLEQVPPNSFISIKNNLESAKSDHIESLQPSEVTKEISENADKNVNSCPNLPLNNIKSPESDLITSQNQSEKLPQACCDNETVKIPEDGDESVDTSPNHPSDTINSPRNGPSFTNDLNQNEKHTYECKMPRYIRFSDFGRPEEFANCLEAPSASSKKNLEPKIKAKEADFSEASASGSEKPIIIQSDDIDSCSPNNSPSTSLSASLDILNHSKIITFLNDKKVIVIDDEHSIEVRDNPDLHSMGYDDKLEVIKLLAKGWNDKLLFEKRVIKKCLCSEKCVLGEILHAVFGIKICTFLLFKVIPKEKSIQIRLHPSFYTDDHFEVIMSRLHCKKNLQPKIETNTGLNKASASGCDRPSQSNSIDSCSSIPLPPRSLNASPNVLNLDCDYDRRLTILDDKKVIVINSTHTINVEDNPSLHKMEYDEKVAVIKILAEGWKRRHTFIKRVKQQIHV